MKNAAIVPKVKVQKFHKDTFDNISVERKKRILDVAVKEFALNGYNATNINIIAKKADISIGSLYSYFASKEDLFLTIVDIGFNMLEEVLNRVDSSQGDIFSKLELLFKSAREYSIEYPEMNQIYLDLTTQGLSKLSNRLSNKMETITARFYESSINEAKSSGIVSPDIDTGTASFLIDNMLTMYQFSFASDYYRDRMKIFIVQREDMGDELIICEIIKFIRRSLIV